MEDRGEQRQELRWVLCSQDQEQGGVLGRLRWCRGRQSRRGVWGEVGRERNPSGHFCRDVGGEERLEGSHRDFGEREAFKNDLEDAEINVAVGQACWVKPLFLTQPPALSPAHHPQVLFIVGDLDF